MSGQISYKRGRIGEDLACAHLKELGHEIIARNFRADGGEIDIISRFGETIFFSEVKARKKASLIPIEESISHDKRARLQRAAQAFLSCNHTFEPNAVFLFIFLILGADGSLKKINIFQDFL